MRVKRNWISTGIVTTLFKGLTKKKFFRVYHPVGGKSINYFFDFPENVRPKRLEGLMQQVERFAQPRLVLHDSWHSLGL